MTDPKELIEKLAREAGITFDLAYDGAEVPIWQAMPHELEAFAQAVARECIRLLEGNAMLRDSSQQSTEAKALRASADVIRERFGLPAKE